MLSRFYFKEVWKEIPFIITVICGLTVQIVLTIFAKGAYEALVLPSTYEVLTVVRKFQPAVLVLLALYSGELFSRDKVIKISPLLDVLPYSNGFRLMAQIQAMIGVLISLLSLFMLTGMLTQISMGFYQLNIGLYLIRLFTELLFNGAFIIILAFFIHVLVNHKFLGHALTVLLIIMQNYLPIWGLEHKLYQYAKMSLGPYSDLVGFEANSVLSFIYYAFYWTGMALIMAQLSKALIIRGIETRLKTRMVLARQRFRKPIAIPMLLGVLLFIGSGATIYVNTSVTNNFQSQKDVECYKLSYEQQLKRFEEVANPEIKGIALEVDLFPSKGAYNLKGTYTMVNPGTEPITEIHTQEDFDENILTHTLSFNREYALKEEYQGFKYSVYQLTQPLAPGDSITMAFEMSYAQKGFAQPRRQYIPQNAAFFTESHLPSLGYESGFEIEAAPTRIRLGLPPKQRLPEIDDPTAYTMGLNSAHNVWFEAKISTKAGFYATTSGQLMDQHSEDGRTYFHYKSARPIENQYAIITGKLEEQTSYLAQGDDSVKLSLYYHSSHTYNLEDISQAMQASFKNFQTNFSPYQYDRMNLMEVPRTHDFAMSIPNTIAFSEGMGFMLQADQDGLNIPFYITAHEIAHQWWGDQVRGAVVKGEDMITETLAQYGAGIVTLQEFGEESLQRMLKYERSRYLKGRKREVQIEQPLYKAENQSYIHYGKGLINMMALRHYISEDSVNSALRRIIRDFPAREGVYPSSLDVITEFRKSTPDSLQYLVTDLFEKIIFLENRVQDARSKSLPDGRYELTVDLLTEKYESDAEGLLQQIPTHDWIELAVYGIGADGKETIIHRQMYQFNQAASTLLIDLKLAPTRIMMDPATILMDRNLDDNEWRF